MAGIGQFFDGSNNGLGDVGLGEKGCHCDCGDKRNFHLRQYKLDCEGVAIGSFCFVEISAGSPICCVDCRGLGGGLANGFCCYRAYICIVIDEVGIVLIHFGSVDVIDGGFCYGDGV